MGWAGSRVFVVFALLFAAGYLIQLDDSARPAGARPHPHPSVGVTPFLVREADTQGREFFTSHQEFVPLGYPTITLPILMYHYVRKPPSTLTDWMGYRLSVAPEVFQAQMDWLHSSGYHPVDFNDVRGYFAGVRPLPPRPVVITLDDGYKDLYTTAFPILAAHQFKAVAYIVTGFVGQGPYVSRDDVVALDRGGIQIASHTVSHPNLAKASYGSAMYQLVQSKLWLEQLVGHQVLDFAYPSGQFNGDTMAEVRLAGYDTAVTVDGSSFHSQADRYRWTRVRVLGGESMGDFRASLGASMPTVKVTTLQVGPWPKARREAQAIVNVRRARVNRPLLS
jgi:peptidoglycan/xylan/chitin deacetylase (PgdA/CDA1 family)